VAYDFSSAVIQGNNEIMRNNRGFSAVPKQISNFGSVRKPVLCQVCISSVTGVCNIHVYFCSVVCYVSTFKSSAGLHISSLLLLFTAIGFAPDGSSPTLVQTKTMKQHYTIITTQYNKT
jgi:hypothetical protein